MKGWKNYLGKIKLNSYLMFGPLIVLSASCTDPANPSNKSFKTTDSMVQPKNRLDVSINVDAENLAQTKVIKKNDTIVILEAYQEEFSSCEKHQDCIIVDQKCFNPCGPCGEIILEGDIFPWRQNLVENTQFANNLAPKSQKRILKPDISLVSSTNLLIY